LIVTYEDKDEEIEKDIDGAAAYKKTVYIETVTVFLFINSVPCIVERTTAELSSNRWLEKGVGIPLK